MAFIPDNDVPHYYPHREQPAKWQEVWTTKEGEQIKVADMSEEHVRNALNMLLRDNRLAMQQLTIEINNM